MQTLKACSLFVALMLGSGVALADTSYPGYTCLTKNESLSRVGSKYESSDLAATLTVACPVVRTTMPGGVAAGSRVFVFDRHPTINVSCTLTTSALDGATVGFSTRTSSGSSAGVQILDFGALAGMVDGHFTLYCSLPPEFNGARSSIASYLIKN